MTGTYEFRIVFEHEPAARQKRYHVEHRAVLFGVVPLWWKRQVTKVVDAHKAAPPIFIKGGYTTEHEARENLDKLKTKLKQKRKKISSVIYRERVNFNDDEITQ